VTGSIEATKASRLSRRSVTSRSFSFNAFGIRSAMGRYWQTLPQMARLLFTHPGILMGNNNPGANSRFWYARASWDKH
jgi:hypothetical protein